MSKYSVQEVAEIVESEGLGYAITGYLDADKIEDETLRELWKQAADILGKIEKIIEPYGF
jgi:hypothetical protein